MPPLFAAGIRFLIAGALIGGWVVWRYGVALLRPPRDELLTALAVGVLLPGGNGLLFVAEQDVPTGVSSLIIGSAPLFIVLLRWAFGDRPVRAVLVGTMAGFVGLAVLAGPAESGSVQGVALVIGSALSWAFGSVLAARRPMPSNSFAATSIEMLAGAAVLIPLGILFRGDRSLNPADFSARSLAGFVYLVVVGSLVGYTCYVWLLANAPLGTVATYAYVNPIVAIALGVAILGEAVTWTMLVGAAVILVSVAIVIRNETPSSTPLAE